MPIDYAEMAKEFGGIAELPTDKLTAPVTDYAEMAKGFGGSIQALTPEQAPQQQPQAPENASYPLTDMFTGAGRIVPTTEQLDDWIMMPEVNALDSSGIKTAIGTTLTSSEGKAAAIMALNPSVTKRYDDKGNIILKSSNGKEYAIKPGFRASDLLDVGTGVALAGLEAVVAPFLAPWMGLTGGAVAAGIGTQGAMEGLKEVTGGTGDVSNVALAGVAPLVGPALKAGGRAMAEGMNNMLTMAAKGSPEARMAVQKAMLLEPEVVNLSAKNAGVDLASIAPDTGVGRMEQAINIAETGSGEMNIAETAKKVRAAAKPLASKATVRGLAEDMNLNPEALAAEGRLGTNLPVDVLSDEYALKAAAGQARSKSTSEAEKAWDSSVRQFTTKIEEGFGKAGAISGGQGSARGFSVSDASDKIRESLKSARTALVEEAKVVSRQVDEVVPQDSLMSLDNIKSKMDEIVKGFRGDVSQLNPLEKDLLELSQNENVSYSALMRVKRRVGAALEGKASKYKDSVEHSELLDMYHPLKNDQLANVEKYGADNGIDGLGDKLAEANAKYSKAFNYTKDIVANFGFKEEGSIGSKLIGMIKSSKTDSTKLNEIMGVVPEDMMGEVLMTAIGHSSVANTGKVKGSFGASEFVDTFKNIERNTSVKKMVIDSIGKDNYQFLRDTFELSGRITQARALTYGTGKSLQDVGEALGAKTLVEKIMTSIPGRVATASALASTTGGASVIATPVITNAMVGGGKKTIKAASELFRDEGFKKLAVEAALNKPDRIAQAAVNRVASSTPFAKFAKATNMSPNFSQSVKWLNTALNRKQEDKK